MIVVLLILLQWSPQPYNWHKCGSDGVYDFYVGAEFLCVDGQIHLTGSHAVRILPRMGLKQCLGGPGSPTSEDCMRYDYDADRSVTLRDVAIWMNIGSLKR